jgi:hypothetical protein
MYRRIALQDRGPARVLRGIGDCLTGEWATC